VLLSGVQLCGNSVIYELISYDNPLAETINGLYKEEVIYKDGPWRGLDDVGRAALPRVEWLGNRQLLRPIGHIAPA